MSRLALALAWTALALPAPAQEESDRERERRLHREAQERVRAFQQEVRRAGEAPEVARAIQNLGEVRHDLIRTELVRWLTGHPAGEVRIAAARELGRYEEDAEAAQALLAALPRQQEKDVMVAFLREVGAIRSRDPRICRDLTRHFEHAQVEVAKEAILTAGDIRAIDFIDPLIALVMKLEQYADDEAGTTGSTGTGGRGDAPGAAQAEEQFRRKRDCLPAALRALASITRQDFVTGREWNDWWRQNRRTFRLPQDEEE